MLSPSHRLAFVVLAMCTALVLFERRPLASPDDVRGRDAVPDYARVFPSDIVNRLDISISPASWNTMLADMVSLAGTRGQGGLAGGGGGGGGQQPGGGQPGGGQPGGGQPGGGQPGGGSCFPRRPSPRARDSWRPPPALSERRPLPDDVFRRAHPASLPAWRCRVAAGARSGAAWSGAAATRRATTWNCCSEIRSTCRPTSRSTANRSSTWASGSRATPV